VIAKPLIPAIVATGFNPTSAKRPDNDGVGKIMPGCGRMPAVQFDLGIREQDFQILGGEFFFHDSRPEMSLLLIS
jgi:hypothetical protein